ncbi:MAG: hypothetical protein HY717_10420 [Planctomycetes bacterium]|nr:hypothetical protein [Planctomycetota bacterium]
METAAPAAAAIQCPRCAASLHVENLGLNQCPMCDWAGEVYLFSPPVQEAEKAEKALPDEATCAHHPSKKAVAVCAGTGDYICSLCAITLEGKVYSAQFLNRGGRAKLEKAFDRYLSRPDRQVALALLLTLLFWIASPLTVPYGLLRCFSVFKLRRENELFRRVVGGGQAALLVILVLIFAAFFGLMIAFMVIGIVHGR